MLFFAEASGLAGMFSNNLVNWMLLIIFLAWLWQRCMPAIFVKREESINSALAAAADSKRQSEEYCREQEKRVAKAEEEAKNILTEAERLAAEMSEQIAAQSKSDADDLMLKIKHQIDAQRTLAITELRSQAATVAVRLAEASLPGAITDNARHRLQDQFINQLDNISKN